MKLDALWVIAAALVNFGLYVLWRQIFRESWLKARRLSDKQAVNTDIKSHLVAFIGSLWASYGVFLICKHIEPVRFDQQLTVALGSWLFIQVGMGAKHYSYARLNGKAFALDYGVDLIGFVIITFMVW